VVAGSHSVHTRECSHCLVRANSFFLQRECATHVGYGAYREALTLTRLTGFAHLLIIIRAKHSSVDATLVNNFRNFINTSVLLIFLERTDYSYFVFCGEILLLMRYQFIQTRVRTHMYNMRAYVHTSSCKIRRLTPLLRRIKVSQKMMSVSLARLIR